jgi:hypothetical protein
MVALVCSGLVRAKAERTFAGGKPVGAIRLRITDAGRRALAVRGHKTLYTGLVRC